jgi:murein DD-endopeptidase MepM/ murein hydrolase activator NlpD
VISRLFRLCLWALALTTLSSAQPLKLRLPTENQAILDGRPDKFYMYVNRIFEGETSKPWQGGGYGFVRNMKRTEAGVIGTRFHEGIDIRPVKRDSAGRPLDEVRALAVGVVAYVQPNSGGSNYGKYVVLEHNWGDGPFFSLYAHLSTISVKLGDSVHAGQAIARMGYTGVGITRERAHVHVELNILLSLRFDDWHRMKFGTDNKHGLHNGMNLSGLDIATLLITHHKDPQVTIPSFLERATTYFKVTTPRRGVLELAKRYPWLRKGDHNRPSPSWEISFSPSGFPLAIAPSHREVSKALVTYVRTTQSRHEFFTLSRLTGTGRRASLTKSGLLHLALITGEFRK